MRKTMIKVYLAILIFLLPLSAYSGEWVAVEGGVSEINIAEKNIEDILWSYLRTSSDREFEPRETYTYQYQVINNNILKINAMCRVTKGGKLYKEFIYTDDGGSCYFEVNYHLQTGKFTKLYVNGFA